MPRENFEEIVQLLKPVELTPLSAKPLVSILTPNYNYAKFVAEAIESVLAQTYANFEMIICDDGSKDNSCEVIERYAQRDSRVKLVRQKNAGVAAALNAAYRQSAGEVICLLDADDRYMPEKLAKIVESFHSHSNSGFLVHRVFNIDATGRRCGTTPLLADHPSGWYGPYVIRHGDLPPSLFAGAALCMRREIGDLIFPLDLKFKSILDTVIVVKATLMTPLVWLSFPLGEYRFHGANLTNITTITPDSWNRTLQMARAMWELRKDYLRSIDPKLAEILPDYDKRAGAPIGEYIQARLRSWGDAISAYGNLIRSDGLSRSPFAARLFWRISILLPTPLFYCAMNLVLYPNRLRHLIWKMKQFTKEPAQELIDHARVL